MTNGGNEQRRDARSATMIVRICLILLALIALAGGGMQMLLGQPETTPRLDNVHRFMAGIYLSTAVISGWCAWTIARQSTLVHLLALGVFIGGCGRLLSIMVVGLPEPAPLWLGYLIPELTLPLVMTLAQRVRDRPGA